MTFSIEAGTGPVANGGWGCGAKPGGVEEKGGRGNDGEDDDMVGDVVEKTPARVYVAFLFFLFLFFFFFLGQLHLGKDVHKLVFVGALDHGRDRDLLKPRLP